MPNLTIDGKEFEFENGQTIIQVAEANGIDIPHFCWHDSLSVSGNCRTCLVEVEKMPKLVIACATMASDGMVVHTLSEKALKARNAVMEFILINHPLDCPICDEAGECKLQDYAYKHGSGESRFVEEKVHKDKRVSLGPRIMLDVERCIMCSRCIRFSDEVAGKNQLTFTKRGDRVTLTTFPGEEFDNPYTLNTVDICPVGALTSKDWRFKTRVWETSQTKSVCNGCARGCNIDVWVRNNEIMRLTPRRNDDVNSYWMCDNGRINTYKHINDAESRVDGPAVKNEGKLVKAGWDEAVETAVKGLSNFKGSQIAFVGSAYTALEDNYVLAQFANHLGVKNVDFLKHTVPGDEDDLFIREDKTPNSLGAELACVKPNDDLSGLMQQIDEGKIKALVVVEDDLLCFDESYKSSLEKLEFLLLLVTNNVKTTELADVVLPASTYAEKNATIVNFQGRVQRMRPAVATEEADRALDGMSMSRWDKFGSKFDRWMQGKRYDARPSWRILTEIANGMGAKFKFNMAEEVFDHISKHNDVFKGIDYDDIGEQGYKLENIESGKTEKV